MSTRRGSRNVSGAAVEERTVAEALRRVQLQAQQTGGLAPSADDLSSVLAARIFAGRIVPLVPIAADANAQLAAQIFGRRATGGGSGNRTLTFDTHLHAGGSSYDGTADVTLTSDATDANTVSTIVARDAGGSFHATTITLSGDLTATGGTGHFLHLSTGDVVSTGNISATGSTGSFLHLLAGDSTIAGGFGCNTKSPQSSASLGGASTDLPTVIALANAIRTALIANGIGS